MDVLSGKILIADDEPSIVDFLSYYLISKGHIVNTAFDGKEAILKSKEFQPDIILMDVNMPEKNGIDATREMRRIPGFEEIPIILLTALTSEEHEITGLKAGADDYIKKPVRPEILNARISSALRRMPKYKNQEQKITFDNFEINLTNFYVRVAGKKIVLVKKEFELLLLLASRPGRIFLRNEIIQHVWGTDVIIGDRTIDVHIRKIRLKLGIEVIKTVKGSGYKFELS